MRAAPRRAMGLDDLPAIPDVFSLALSPDGVRLAFVVATGDERTNRVRHRLMLLSLDPDGRSAGRSRTLLRGTHRLGQPRWSPDGSRLAYVDDRGGTPQLWASDASGEHRQRLTAHPSGVGSPAWAPDGRSLVVIADAGPGLDDPVPIVPSDPSRRVVRVTGHRHKLEGRGWLTVDGPRRQLWLVDAATGAMRQLTDGHAEAEAPAWSPDGRSIAFMADRSSEMDRHFGGEQIHSVDVTSRVVRRLTQEGVSCANPAWSPDGRSVAYLRAESPIQLDGHLERLWVVDVDGGREACWSTPIDRPVGFRPGGYRTPSAPAWSVDGASILQIVADRGTSHLARFEPGRMEVLTGGPEAVLAFSPSDDRQRVAYLRAEARTSPEPWLWSAERPVRRLWASWPASLRAVQRIEPAREELRRPDGTAIDSWLLLPEPTPPDGHPLVLMVHGGPHNAFGERFLPDAQLLAGAGHAVLLVNPRGSGGASEAFGRAVIGDWGGADLQDLLAVLDETLARHADRLDPQRTAIMGGSYGGFMATWAITRTSRFTCAVAGAPVTWQEAMALTSDIGMSWAVAEQATDDRASSPRDADRSPLRGAARITTPLLLYHGESDLRVPIAQSEALLTAITAGGGHAELLRVPGEGHVLPGDASPVHARQVREAVLAFLGRYLLPGRSSS